jgi:hypothetical protein
VRTQGTTRARGHEGEARAATVVEAAATRPPVAAPVAAPMAAERFRGQLIYSDA